MAHSIWELVLHIEAWDNVSPPPARMKRWNRSDEQNFPPVMDAERSRLAEGARVSPKYPHNELVKTVAAFPDERLQERVPGKDRGLLQFLLPVQRDRAARAVSRGTDCFVEEIPAEIAIAEIFALPLTNRGTAVPTPMRQFSALTLR